MRAFVFIFLAAASVSPKVAEAAPAFDDKPAVTADNAQASAGANNAAGSAEGTGVSIASFLGTNRFGLAPLRWGGNMTDTFRWARDGNGMTSTNHFQSVNLRAASYLWQPWLAQINGSLNFAQGVAGASEGDGDTTNQSVSGFVNLNVFPQSRFPFSVDYEVSDSRTESKITQETQNKRLSLRQEYRPPTGNEHYSFKYDNSILTTNTSDDKDTVSSYQASYTNSFKNQMLGLDAQRTESDQGGGGQGLVLDNYMLRHTWRGSNKLSIDSNASFSDSEYRDKDSGVNHSQYLQGYSTATWNPRDNVSVNGGLRYFNLINEFGGEKSETESAGANVGVNYNPTRNLGLNGSLTFTTTSTKNGSNWISTQNVGANYNHDPLVFGNFSYNWGVGGGASNQISKDEASSMSFNASGTHSLNHRYQFNEYTSLTSFIGETLTMRYGQGSSASETLNHNAGISLSVTPNEVLSGAVTLSASDSRSFGEEQTDNQSVSLQTNGSIQMSQYSSATANINLQWNRSGTEDPASDNLQTWSASGGASYMHTRAFGVPRLKYTLLFSINTSDSNARLLGDASAERGHSGYTLDQHLDYQIGRLDARLTATQAMQDGKDNAMIYLQIGRSFGNY